MGRYNINNDLYDAVQVNDLELIDTLINEGADINSFVNCRTPIMEAAWNGNIATFLCLLNYNPDLQRTDYSGNTLLYFIVHGRASEEVIYELLDIISDKVQFNNRQICKCIEQFFIPFNNHSAAVMSKLLQLYPLGKSDLSELLINLVSVSMIAADNDQTSLELGKCLIEHGVNMELIKRRMPDIVEVALYHGQQLLANEISNRLAEKTADNTQKHEEVAKFSFL